MDCAICFEQITLSTGSATLSCQHAYHLGCIMLSIQAGLYTCPCCRHQLTSAELPQHINQESYDQNNSEIAEDIVDVTITLSNRPGQVTEQMVNNLYMEPLAKYIWHRCAQRNVCHYASYSTVYTSMLTMQAAARGFLTRRRLRVAPAPTN